MQHYRRLNATSLEGTSDRPRDFPARSERGADLAVDGLVPEEVAVGGAEVMGASARRHSPVVRLMTSRFYATG